MTGSRENSKAIKKPDTKDIIEKLKKGIIDDTEAYYPPDYLSGNTNQLMKKDSDNND